MYQAFRPFRLQPPDAPRHRFVTLPFSLPGFPSTSVPGLGFADHQRARHAIRPNRVHLRFGLVVHLQLLSTWPRGHAVTFSYGPENVCPERTRTSLTWYTLGRTGTGVPPVLCNIKVENR
jgi:hypothetical protein